MVNQKRLLVGTLFTIYEHFGDVVKCIFTILLQIQNENNILPTSKHRQAKVRRFLVLSVRLLHFSLKVRLPKTSRNQTPSWLRSQKSE